MDRTVTRIMAELLFEERIDDLESGWREFLSGMLDDTKLATIAKKDIARVVEFLGDRDVKYLLSPEHMDPEALEFKAFDDDCRVVAEAERFEIKKRGPVPESAP